MNLPFTRKETEYLRNLVEQEKIRLIEDVYQMKARAGFSDNQKEILKKVVSKNYFDTDSHIKKAQESIDLLMGIEDQLYPKVIKKALE